MSKIKLIPQLRFKDFRSSKGWDEKSLTEISAIIAGQSPDGNSYNDVGVGTPFYQGKTDYGTLYLNKPTKWTTMPTKFADSGDILISVRAPVGSLNVSTERICIGRGLAAIQTQENKWFLFYFLDSIQSKIIGNGGSVFDSITKDQIEKIKIFLPQTEEQKKIADCLSSLDDVITAQTQKLDILKAHKKGLMQDLFPGEGESVPRVRFSEFENDGEWLEKSFEELFTIGNGRDYKHLEKGEIPVYGSGGYMLSVNEYLNDGDSPAIGRKGTIDKPMYLTGKFWTVDTLFFTHSFNNCLPKYIFYVFEKIDWLKHNEAGGVPSLSKTNIYKIVVRIPDENEQQKIVDCLTALDDQIQFQTQKLESLKLHKKGLMQQLFPNISEL